MSASERGVARLSGVKHECAYPCALRVTSGPWCPTCALFRLNHAIRFGPFGWFDSGSGRLAPPGGGAAGFASISYCCPPAYFLGFGRLSPSVRSLCVMARARSAGASLEKVASPGARRVIADALTEGITKERVTALVDAAFESEIVATFVCEECGHAMKARAPDLKKQVDSMVALLEQAEGRPEQRQPEATTVIIERPAL